MPSPIDCLVDAIDLYATIKDAKLSKLVKKALSALQDDVSDDTYDPSDEVTLRFDELKKRLVELADEDFDSEIDEDAKVAGSIAPKNEDDEEEEDDVTIPQVIDDDPSEDDEVIQ